MYIRLLTLFFGVLGASSLYAQILPTFGNSRTGGSGMQFLKISPDAKALAMGSTGVSTASDLSAIYWNPAGITGMDTAKFHLMASHTRYFGDITGNYLSGGFKAGSLSFLAFHVFSMNYGEMKETTEFEPDGTGRTFQVSNYSLGMTYAKILTNNFSFGLTGKYANEGFAGVAIHNILFDLGLKYNVGIRNARFGINFSNFGLNISPTGEVTIAKFSGDQEVTDYSTITVPAMFRLGAAFDPISKGDHQVTVSGQLSHPTDNNEIYALGLEYRYLGILCARTGYEFNADDSYAFPSAGLGLRMTRRMGGMGLDYGFLAKNSLGNVHRITLSMYFR